MADQDLGTLGPPVAGFSSAMVGGHALGTLSALGASGTGHSPLARVARADCWASDLVQFVFGQGMRNEAPLATASSYSIAPSVAGAARSPVVLDVLVAAPAIEYPYAFEVFLVVDALATGVEYTVTARLDALWTAAGTRLKHGRNSARFLGRRTRIDAALETRPPLYTQAPRSVHRSLLHAIMHDTEVWAGGRNDRLP